MTHASRPQWRLFCLALLMALAVAPLKSQTPALTTISDTVFRANGSPASGILLISWPAFSTAGGATAADLGFASKPTWSAALSRWLESWEAVARTARRACTATRPGPDVVPGVEAPDLLRGC